MRYLPVLILVGLLLVGCTARDKAPDTLAADETLAPPPAPANPSVRPDIVRAEVTVRQSGDVWRVHIDRILEQNTSEGSGWAHLRAGDDVDANFLGKILIMGAPVTKVECPVGSTAQLTKQSIEALADQQSKVAGDLDAGTYVAQLTHGYFSAEDEAAKRLSTSFSVDVPITAPVELECVALSAGGP